MHLLVLNVRVNECGCSATSPLKWIPIDDSHTSRSQASVQVGVLSHSTDVCQKIDIVAPIEQRSDAEGIKSMLIVVALDASLDVASFRGKWSRCVMASAAR